VLDPDGKIGKLYGAQTTPHIFIVNANGQLVYKGGIDSIASTNKSDLAKAENYVASALQAVAAGKPVDKASTKPYGCSIKYAG
jgi:sensor domain CHASE-containing protein